MWNARAAAPRRRLRPVRRPAGAGASCCRCCIPACSRTWRRCTTSIAADLLAILLTGIPAGLDPRVPELHRPDAGRHAAPQRGDPAERPTPNLNGILGGDLAGFPNGRRVFDNIVTIELQAIAGATYPLVDPTYVPDGAAALINDGVLPPGNVSYLDVFPYLDHPVSGYDVQPLSV